MVVCNIVLFRKANQGHTIIRNLLYAQVEALADRVRNGYIVVLDTPVGLDGRYFLHFSICIRLILNRAVPSLLVEGRCPAAVRDSKIFIFLIFNILKGFRLLSAIVLRGIEVTRIDILLRRGEPTLFRVRHLELYPSFLVIQIVLVHQHGFRLEVDLVYLVAVVRDNLNRIVSSGIVDGHIVLDIV